MEGAQTFHRQLLADFYLVGKRFVPPNRRGAPALSFSGAADYALIYANQ